MKLIYLGILIFFFKMGNAQSIRPSKQDVLNKFGFSEHFIITSEDTVAFYLHKKPNKDPKNLVLYLQGTSADPLFVLEENKEEFTSYRWFPGDYKLLDEDYCYVVIAKSGIPGIFEKDTKRNITKYHQFNSLDNRVFRADTVIKYINEYLYSNLDKIIVYGHSEGAPVAAKLATINKDITHLGFWAGNALPDYFDFLLDVSKKNWTKQLPDSVAYKNIIETFTSFEEVAKKRENVSASGKDDYTAKRWWSYAEPPINNLLKLEIPLFVQVAGKDESAPMESSFLIPLEFIRLGKNNLRYEICMECDHGFVIESENGKIEDKWESIFLKFIDWTKENNH